MSSKFWWGWINKVRLSITQPDVSKLTEDKRWVGGLGPLGMNSGKTFPTTSWTMSSFCNSLQRCETNKFRENSSLQRKQGSGESKDTRTPENSGNAKTANPYNIRHLSYGTCQGILRKKFSTAFVE